MRKTEVQRKYKYFQIKREQGDIEKAACSVCSNICIQARMLHTLKAGQRPVRLKNCQLS